MNESFQPWSIEHLLALGVIIIIGVCIIYLSKKYLSITQQSYSISFFVIIIAWVQIAKVYIKLSQGVFDLSEDLPFHLCNMLPFFLPYPLFFRNERVWAIMYFFIIGGTAQSLVTPTLVEQVPNYEYWRYWIVHGGLVIAALYPIFVWNFKVVFKDIFVSWWSLNVLAFLMMVVSIPVGGNYMYMLRHPTGDTLYNMLGPWPYYIISLQFVALAVFYLLYLPVKKQMK